MRVNWGSWFALSADYLDTEKISGSILAPGQGSFFPSILITEAKSYRLGAIATWRPFERVALYAKPMLAIQQVGHVMTGGTAAPEDPSETIWQTSSSTRLVPAVGAAVRLGRGLSLGLEFEKSRLWRMDSESFTAYLSYQF